MIPVLILFLTMPLSCVLFLYQSSESTGRGEIEKCPEPLGLAEVLRPPSLFGNGDNACGRLPGEASP